MYKQQWRQQTCMYVDSRSFLGIWNPSASPLIVNHVTGWVASSTWLVSQKLFFMRRIGWWELQQICDQSSYFAFGAASKPSLIYTIYTLFLLELGRYSLWVSSLNMYGKERQKKGRGDGLPPGKKKNLFCHEPPPPLFIPTISYSPPNPVSLPLSSPKSLPAASVFPSPPLTAPLPPKFIGFNSRHRQLHMPKLIIRDAEAAWSIHHNQFRGTERE